jgi:hypothetical protein
MSRPEKMQAALRLMGDPYASLSLCADEEEFVTAESTFEQKRAYFKKLEDPHADSEIFGDSDENLWQVAAKRDKEKNIVIFLKNELDGVLSKYRPFVDKKEWSKLMEFKPYFIQKASQNHEQAERVANRLQQFKFSLHLPGEKAAHNRAEADPIIKNLLQIID